MAGCHVSKRLRELTENTVGALGYELVGIEHLPQGRRSLLRVYIDTPGGITLDDCERASRQLNAALDVEDPIRNQYVLEVSSPGLDRPLFTAEHYARFTGHQVKLRLRVPRNGRRNFKGLLEGIQDSQVAIRQDDGQVILPLDDIEQARLIPEI